MAALRTAIIGFGSSGRVFHAPLVAADPEYSLDAVVTRNEDRAGEVAARYPAARVVSDVDELLASAGELDLVIVGSPPATHAELAHAVLDAGLGVVVDKPFTVTAAQGRELVAKAGRLGLPLTVFQNRRWDGDFRTVRKLLADGVFGEVWRFESRFERWRPGRPVSWKTATTVSDGGGILYDLGSHLIDQALQLFGAAEPVYAEVLRRGADVEADDDTFVVLRHESGIHSHLWLSSRAAQSGPRMRVLGSRAGYTKYGLDPQENALRAGAIPTDPSFGREPETSWGVLGAGDEIRTVATERGHYAGFYAELASALRGGGALPVDPLDSVRVIELVETIHRDR